MKKSKVLTATAAVLLLAACGSSDDGQRRAAEERPKEGGGRVQPELAKKPERRARRGRSATGGRTNTSRPPRNASSPRGEQAAGGSRPPRSVRRRPQARLFPATGRYRYSQTGYEDFCQAGTCRREPLPGVQTIATRLLGRSGARATVESQERGSRYRTVRIVTAYTPERALLTDVSFRVSYQGLTYSRAYRPRPPIASLRFPLSPGRRWSGRWDAPTSGSYVVRVVGRDPVTAAGRRIGAVKVATTTYLRGELRGRVDVTAWIDPRTKAVVRMIGDVDVASTVGRYISKFHALLASAPGY